MKHRPSLKKDKLCKKLLIRFSKTMDPRTSWINWDKNPGYLLFYKGLVIILINRSSKMNRRTKKKNLFCN